MLLQNSGMDFFIPPNNPYSLVIIRSASRLDDNFNWFMTLRELIKHNLSFFYLLIMDNMRISGDEPSSVSNEVMPQKFQNKLISHKGGWCN